LFVERGYVGVRVEDIATAAGISRATFYKHFSGREEILAELFGRLLGRDPVNPPPGGANEALPRGRALLIAAAVRMQENDQLARFVYTLPIRHDSLIGPGARPPVLEMVERLIEDGAEAGAVRSEAARPMRRRTSASCSTSRSMAPPVLRKLRVHSRACGADHTLERAARALGLGWRIGQPG
jgi:AcrR family transcriptional regulator